MYAIRSYYANSFQPFDPEEILGVPKNIYVTQLANRRVIVEVGSRMGFNFSEESYNFV